MRKTSGKVKLLFLSAGSLVGQNILSALESRRDLVHMIALNSKIDEPSIFEFDETYKVPITAEGSDSYHKRYSEIVKATGPDLIIPCRDEDVAFLANLRENNESQSNRLLCGAKSVASSMLNKEMSWKFSLEHDLPFVPTIGADTDVTKIDQFIQQVGFPLLVKPKQGFASRQVFIITKKKQLQFFLANPGFIIQKYLGNIDKVHEYEEQLQNNGFPLYHTFEEDKISVQSSIGSDGEVGAVFVTKHTMKSGKSNVVEVYKEPSVHQMATDWTRKFVKAGWRGPLNIQCQYNQDGELFIYEYNGRFTGATSARVLLGMDEVGILLNMWIGSFPYNRQQTGNEMVIRSPFSRMVETSKVNTLEETGYWSPGKVSIS